ncbi:MAG: MFS transporter, partial [Sedimentisphaerales bacterium]|nr:MFS transporter [Sedimentisphaerales bacterium]
FLAVRQTSFKNLFVVMFLYCLCFAATLPLVNSLMFSQLAKNNLDSAVYSKWIFFWAPVSWALIGYGLTGWRWKFKTGEQGRDCLYLAAILSVIMGIGCFFMPDTPPAKAGTAPILQAMGMLKETNFLIFIVISMIFFGLMQFYFLGTAQFMQNMGIPAKNVPASMAIAQGVQAIATLLLMALLLGSLGAKWTLVIGSAFWLFLYIVYINGKPRWLIVCSQAFHGLAYVLFVIVGQIFADMFADSIGKAEIKASVQSLLFAATTGVGLFLGTQFAGFIMDKFRKEEQFQWRQIFMVPGVIAFVSILVLIILFK